MTTGATWVSDAFGDHATGGTDYQHTANHLDADAGLFYFNNRWYDVELGRFTQRNTPFQPLAEHAYVISEGNPLRWMDRSGYGPLDPPVVPGTIPSINVSDPAYFIQPPYRDYDIEIDYGKLPKNSPDYNCFSHALNSPGGPHDWMSAEEALETVKNGDYRQVDPTNSEDPIQAGDVLFYHKRRGGGPSHAAIVTQCDEDNRVEQINHKPGSFDPVTTGPNAWTRNPGGVDIQLGGDYGYDIYVYRPILPAVH